MAANSVFLLRSQICRIRCRSFSKTSSSLCQKDNVPENQTEEQTKDTKEKKAQEASKKLLNLISELKVDTSNWNRNTELSSKLAKPVSSNVLPPSQQAKEDTLLSLKLEAKERFSGIEAPLANAVQSVAASIGGDTGQTESELIRALRSYKTETQRAKVDISGLVSSMKVDRTPARKEESYLHRQPRRAPEPRRDAISTRDSNKEDLFGGTPLGIFKKKEHETGGTTPKTLWDMCEEREMRSLHAPAANAFEEMITWTEQGKMWKFPIDNEQGMEQEHNVPFHEHVFLERHLQHGFPQSEPILHFMELVCVGLSKNLFITVERKLEHIQWYREYFERKEAALKEEEEDEIIDKQEIVS